MELGEWTGGWIIENSDNRGSDNRGSTVYANIKSLKPNNTFKFSIVMSQSRPLWLPRK